MPDCSGVFSKRYEVRAPRSVTIEELAVLHEKLVRVLRAQPHEVVCEHHDECLMDDDDPQAEWVFVMVLEHVGPRDPLPLHSREIACRAIHTHFRSGRTVSANDATGLNGFVMHAC